jgi:hypothetical protein
MKRLVIMVLVLGLGACGTTDRAGEAAAGARGAASPPAANASAPDSREAVTRGGIAVQQPVSPMMHQVPTGTERESVSTPTGKIGTTGAF